MLRHHAIYCRTGGRQLQPGTKGHRLRLHLYAAVGAMSVDEHGMAQYPSAGPAHPFSHLLLYAVIEPSAYGFAA